MWSPAWPQPPTHAISLRLSAFPLPLASTLSRSPLCPPFTCPQNSFVEYANPDWQNNRMAAVLTMNDAVEYITGYLQYYTSLSQYTSECLCVYWSDTSDRCRHDAMQT